MLSREQHYIYRLQAQIKQSLFFSLSSVIIDHHVDPLYNFFIGCKLLQDFFLVRILFIFRLYFVIWLSELSCWRFGRRLLLIFGKCGSWLSIILAIFELMTSWSRYTFLSRWRLFATLYPIVNLLLPGETLDRVRWHHWGIIRAHLTIALWYAQRVLRDWMGLLR